MAGIILTQALSRFVVFVSLARERIIRMQSAETLTGFIIAPSVEVPSWLAKSYWHLRDHFIPTDRNNYHPHLFAHRAMGLFSMLLIGVKFFALAALALGPVVPVFSSAITPSNIISLTNQSRSEFSLPALQENNLLDQAAQTKADDMLAKGYFSHNTPDGKTPWDFINAAGYTYLSAGENLAVNFTEAENVETAWMNSPGHKANILNKNFEEIGVGISQGQFEGHSAIFVVQMFGLPAGQIITLQNAPTHVQTTDVPSPLPQAILQNADSSAPSAVAAAVAPTPQPLAISSSQVSLGSATVNVNATVSGPAVKVLAYFGQEAVMLEAKGNNVWSGSIPVDKLVSGTNNVTIAAFDMQGTRVEAPAAAFSGSTAANYSVVDSQAPQAQTSLLGKVFNPRDFADKFYIFVIAGMLGCLALAIGMKKHIQHVSLIANGSFVIMLACLLWMAG